MDFPEGFPTEISEDLAASLPSQRDDEPSSLRQDILDELNDHLQCAVRREQCRQPADERSVWQRVVARFGDPRSIAVKLYWQALWSRVMQQRMILAGGVGGLILGVVMVAMMWMMLDRQQDLVERQLLASDRQQATMEALVARLSNPPSNLASLKVRTDRPASVRLSGGSLTAPIQYTPNAEQKEFDFGELVPGVYLMHVSSAESSKVWEHSRQIVLKSGESHLEDVAIPPVESAEITITTNFPETSFHTMDLWVVSRSKMTFQRSLWQRNQPTSTYRFCKRVSFGADLGDRATLHLIYDPSSNQVKGFLIPPDDQLEQHFRAREKVDTRVFQLQLNPDSNAIQVDVPDQWISRFNRKREREMSKLAGEKIQEEISMMLARESQKKMFTEAATPEKSVAIVPISGIDPDQSHAIYETAFIAIGASNNYRSIDQDLVNRNYRPGSNPSQLQSIRDQLNQPVDYLLIGYVNRENGKLVLQLHDVESGRDIDVTSQIEFLKPEADQRLPGT